MTEAKLWRFTAAVLLTIILIQSITCMTVYVVFLADHNALLDAEIEIERLRVRVPETDPPKLPTTPEARR